MIFKATWRDSEGKLRSSKNWSYEFMVGSIRRKGSCKTENRALAKKVEAERRREAEQGINGIPGKRSR